MTDDVDAALSPATAEIDAKIQYLLPGSLINRRFWAPGEEYNTGKYAPYDVKIRNARLAGPFTLDKHGFAIENHKTDVTDWVANYGPDGEYAEQVQDIVRHMTGADFVIPMGGMLRTSGTTSKEVQPPAGEAHVDFTEKSAERLSEKLYRARRPDGRGYDRFICFSLWRALSPPPQDWPLALCEGPSVKDGEGTHNVKVDVDEIPTGDDLFAEIPGEDEMMAATIFRYSPDHRWWYFPDMTDDEVIFIKFYDSDHSGAWRAPHTAFPDTSRPDAIQRRSFEYRGVAYFTKD